MSASTKPAKYPKPGKVAASIPQWAAAVRKQLNIADSDPEKNQKTWEFNTSGWDFSSGSDLTEQDYLRLRVLWYSWPDTAMFKHYMRDNPALSKGEENTPTPYTGYVSEENDKLATQIYRQLWPRVQGYLKDIRTNKDGTRPSADCQSFSLVRYWQSLVTTRIKEVYTTEEAAKSRKVRKSIDPVDSITASMSTASISGPKTPQKQMASGDELQDFETPAVPISFPAVGGKQNPATSDETYVNTALLLLLQTVTLSVLEIASEELDLGSLEWLADRLPLRMYRRVRTKDGRERLVELMEARVDGFLCKRAYRKTSYGEDVPSYNNLPLAILEAKASTRSAGRTPILWQESAEMACWVSSLADSYENYGLLRLSTSGRRRRLLISQDRHELYIIIAEYGEQWKEYVRGLDVPWPTTAQATSALDLSGSDGFIQNSMAKYRADFTDMVNLAQDIIDKSTSEDLQPSGSSTGRQTRSSQQRSVNQPLELPGPEYFCIMQEWGPFSTKEDEFMDLFIRRLIALQLQLLSNAVHQPESVF